MCVVAGIVGFLTGVATTIVVAQVCMGRDAEDYTGK